MGYLTEPEIIDKLIDSLKIAAQSADDIAIRPDKGRTYTQLRDSLAEAESAFRQYGHWRGDYRWVKSSLLMGECHKRAGEWLRGVPYEVQREDGGVVKRRRPLNLGEKHPLFVMLAQKLREYLAATIKLKERRTGVIGAVLPELPNLGRREGAPVRVILPPGMRKTQGGLIVPQGMASQ